MRVFVKLFATYVYIRIYIITTFCIRYVPHNAFYVQIKTKGSLCVCACMAYVSYKTVGSSRVCINKISFTSPTILQIIVVDFLETPVLPHTYSLSLSHSLYVYPVLPHSLSFSNSLHVHPVLPHIQPPFPTPCMCTPVLPHSFSRYCHTHTHPGTAMSASLLLGVVHSGFTTRSGSSAPSIKALLRLC
jgi:hypothetical protein